MPDRTCVECGSELAKKPGPGRWPKRCDLCRVPRSRPPRQPCGTWAAYKRHRKAGEEPCESCKEASRQQARQRYKPSVGRRQPLKPCGTTAAYFRHWRAGESPCDACREAMANRPRPTEDRVCVSCGVAITVRKDNPTRHCRDCATAVSAMKRRKNWPASPVRIIECVECEVLFVEKEPHRFGRVRCDDCPKAKSDHPGRWWKFLVAGPCAWCGENFVAKAASTDAALPKYCSKSCAARQSKVNSAQPGGGWISPRERLEIYERDGWICQLCAEPVERDADPQRDDLAPSLDHIVCQSWTLFPDHSPENLRLAHRICNSLRGDRLEVA